MSDADSKQPGKKHADKSIQDLIINLSILKKNISMYPQGHITISQTSNHLSEILQGVFENTSRVTMIVMKSRLLVNGRILETNNPHIRDFAVFLSQRGITSLTLLRGLYSDELHYFYQLTLAIPPKSQMHQHKEIHDKIKSLTCIHVRGIDLSSVRFTDEATIDISDPTKVSTTIWHKLMLGCFPPDQQNAKNSTLKDNLGIYAFGSFSRFLQDYKVPLDRVVKSYDLLLSDHIQAPAEQAGQLAGKQEFFRSLYDILPELPPELIDQMLAVTFESINGLENEESLAELLCCMPADMIVAVLEKAKSEKRELSPSLIKLLSTLSRAREYSPGIADIAAQRFDLTWDHIQEFFSREWYEKYMSKEYAEELQKLSSEKIDRQNNKATSFSIDEHIQALQNGNINRQVVAALLNLMEGDLDQKVYCDYAGNISEMIPALIEAGDYKMLGIVYKTLLRQKSNKQLPEDQFAANAALEAFSGEGFISKLSKTYAAQTGRQYTELNELIMLSGNSNLPWLLELYLDQHKGFQDPQLFTLLCQFGPLTAEKALERLPGNNEEQTIALLKLVQSCDGHTANPQLRKFLTSSNSELRLEAIKTLLKNKDSAAVTALRKMIHSNDEKNMLQAFKIIREFTVQELALELASLLKTLFITTTTINRNKIILSILGTLGNINVLPVLESIAFSRFSFTPRNLRETKEFLYKTLSDYPRISVQELVAHGLKSKNEDISNICSRMTIKR